MFPEVEILKREWMEEMQANLNTNDSEMKDFEKTYKEKLAAAEARAAKAGNSEWQKTLEQSKTNPHIVNLNYDPQLSGKIIHIMKKSSTEIGNRKGHESDICMIGPGIHSEHAIITADHKHHKVKIRPCEKDCRVLVNGTAITGETDLDHNDRLVFGSSHTWVFKVSNVARKTLFYRNKYVMYFFLVFFTES